MSRADGISHNTATTTNGAADPELDVSKLHALPTEQQDLFVLTFVSDLRNHVTSLSTESLPAHQPAIKREVVKIIGLGSPVPSRVVRYNLGRILGDAFGRGSRSLLFETINELVILINTGKGDKELGTKHAAVVVLGQIFVAAGDSAISLSALVCTSLVKLLKAAQSHAGARGSIFRALALVVQGVEGSLDENIARDIWKSARNAAAADKAGFVQKSACRCLQSLAQNTPYFYNTNDFENLKTSIWKTLDSPVSTVRHAAAEALASALIRAYTETSPTDQVPMLRKPKKSSKKQNTEPDDDAGEERPTSPPPARSSTGLAFNLTEILKVLSSQYGKASSSNRTRAGLATCYKAILCQLPEKVLEQHYAVIADHFFLDLVNHPTVTFNRYRFLLTRHFVQVLLDEVVAPRLTESAQINASRWIINDVLKNYPKVIQERREPPKRVLVAALRALTGLIQRLGTAATIFQNSCREALLQVMQHPSYTVQNHAAECGRAFALACPGQLVRTIEGALSSLKKEFEAAAESRQSHRKCFGYSLSIASMLSAARLNPLYGSVDLFSRLFTYATELLKTSSSSELRLSATQISVAWTLLGGLTTLGPNFVKVHLNQLLLLWRNACPPPLTHENAAKRGHLEFSFLAHVRECALGALLAFLKSCSTLITADGSRRILQMLQNSIQFLDSLPTVRQAEEISHRLVPALQLDDMAILLRRRIFQCFGELLGLKHLDIGEVVSQVDLVGLTVRTFAQPARPSQKNLEASLASSASNFESLWTVDDNWGFGVNSLVEGYEISIPSKSKVVHIGRKVPSNDRAETSIDNAVASPTAAALEHDPILIYCDPTAKDQATLASPATACITASIRLFAISLPLQPARVQESSLEQLATILAQPLPREPGKKAATHVNAATALLCAFAVANSETGFSTGKLDLRTMGKSVNEILTRCLLDTDSILRNIAAEGIGRLCNLSGTQFTNTGVKQYIDTIVANRDPNARAGCALALGCIHSQVGAMAASFHLKSIVGVLLTLCNDAHPVVHFWALKGMAEVADSAGLSFSAYVTSTLGMLAQLYSSDNHNEESASLATSNAELEFSTPLNVGQCVDCIINVLGPDLQDVAKARNLILILIGYFQIEEGIALQVQSCICLGHLWMYAPAHLQFAKYVHDLQSASVAENEGLQDISVLGLANLMKRNASEVSRVSKSTLNDDIWSNIDRDPHNLELQNMLRNWLQQTCLTETAQWIERCQTILSRTRRKADIKAPGTAVKSAMPDLVDDEVAGFAAAAAASQGEASDSALEGQEFLRWQTRDFAMHLLSEMLDLIKDALLPDQVIPAEATLQSKVADIVRIAFSASTANVVELRVLGLKIIDQILKLFGKTPDPDFLEASLLEQYQAQISSALTPAFAADSSPELAAEAVAVCATFVATGIVTNADRMGRIFKVLANGLDNLAQPIPEAAIGDLKGLSSNGQSMLKMALLSGWAQLQLASVEQHYLEDILQPYVPKLAPLWLSSLQEFAALRFEPEISDTLGDMAGGNLDERYAALHREVRLQFYQNSWLNLVEAISALVDKDSEAVFEALDGKNAQPQQNGTNSLSSGKDMSFREEPVAFFFILFGLAFEALVTQARDNPNQALAILRALKKILTPAVSGNAIYEGTVFDETTDTLDRLAMTSTSGTQAVLVQIARNLSLDHASAKGRQDRDDKLSDDIEQLFELTRIIILVMTGMIPTLDDPPGHAMRPLSEEGVTLIQMCFQALVDVAEVFPSIIRADLHACIFHCYCTILATGTCQVEVVPRVMPIFRSFLQDMAKRSMDGVSGRLVRGCLSRMLAILSYAQRRESNSSIICAKNTLLSMTIVLTTCGNVIPTKDELVVKAVEEFLDCLQDVGLAKIAASCVRSLLLTSPKSSCDEFVSRALWPRILELVNNPSADDPEYVKTPLIQALTATVPILRGPGRSAAMSILVPSLLLRATQALPNGSKENLRKESASRLLELVAVDAAAFRAAVSGLNEAQRSTLETLLRAAGVGAKKKEETDEEADARPAIALRMDFS